MGDVIRRLRSRWIALACLATTALALALVIAVRSAAVRATDDAVLAKRLASIAAGPGIDLELGSPADPSVRIVEASTTTPLRMQVGDEAELVLRLSEISKKGVDLSQFELLRGRLRARVVPSSNDFDVHPVDESWKATTEPNIQWRWSITALAPGARDINYVIEFVSDGSGDASGSKNVLPIDDAVTFAEFPWKFLEQLVIAAIAPGGLCLVVLASITKRDRTKNA